MLCHVQNVLEAKKGSSGVSTIPLGQSLPATTPVTMVLQLCWTQIRAAAAGGDHSLQMREPILCHALMPCHTQTVLEATKGSKISTPPPPADHYQPQQLSAWSCGCQAVMAAAATGGNRSEVE